MVIRAGPTYQVLCALRMLSVYFFYSSTGSGAISLSLILVLVIVQCSLARQQQAFAGASNHLCINGLPVLGLYPAPAMSVQV